MKNVVAACLWGQSPDRSAGASSMGGDLESEEKGRIIAKRLWRAA